jgi:hypothetical protein
MAALFAAKAAQSAGDDLGHGASALAERIIHTIVRRFRGDPERQAQLQAITDAPERQVDVQMLADLLAEAAAENGEFAAELIALTTEAEQAGLLNDFRVPDGGVHVGEVTQKGHNNTLIIGGQVSWRTPGDR